MPNAVVYDRARNSVVAPVLLAFMLLGRALPYFVLSELEAAKGPMGLPIERDPYLTPGPFSEVIRRHRGEHGG